MAKQETKENPKTGKAYPEVMTIDQVAEYLQLHKQVVYRHVKQNQIPASRIGATLRFKKSIIDAWLVDSALKSLQAEAAVPAAGQAPYFNPEED